MARTETVTVVFSALGGSTALARQLSHDGYEWLRHAHFAACRAVVATHHGTAINTTGDGRMLYIASAAHAVACDVTLQQTVALTKWPAARIPSPASPAGEDQGEGSMTEQLDMPAEAAKLQRLREPVAHAGA